MISLEPGGSVFRLAELDFALDHINPAKGLPAVTPDFSLPPLRDEEPIQDRLLRSLRYRPGPDGKGQSRDDQDNTAGVIEAPGIAVHEDAPAAHSVPVDWVDLVGSVGTARDHRVFPVSPRIFLSQLPRAVIWGAIGLTRAGRYGMGRRAWGRRSASGWRPPGWKVRVRIGSLGVSPLHC